MLLALALLLGFGSSARADNCSDYPGGVLDGFAGTIAPSQLYIDRHCTIRNYPASNPLSTNFSFLTQPGQTDQRWIVIFDNVVHTGQMACNAVAGHKIWFVNGSSTSIKQNCQNLLIPVEKIDKQNPAGQTTATIGVPFTYKLIMPVLFDPATGTVINTTGSMDDLHGVTVVDDLNATGASLTYLSHTAYWEGSGAPVAHTFVNAGGVLTFDDFPLITAGEQIIVEITVVLNDVPANAPGTQFVNTAKWDFGRLIDGEFFEPLPGEWGVSPPMTIAAPQVVVTKTGPATLGQTLNLGAWGQFAIDVANNGTLDAWEISLVDRLPDGPAGGMCDLTPELSSVTLAGAPLAQGTDYSWTWSGAPGCELTLTLLGAAGPIGPGEHLLVSYRTKLDPNTQNGLALTNVAGATQWFNDASTNQARQVYTRSVTDGTVGVLDHQDAHTVTSALSGYFFEKSVANLTTGVSPAVLAAPGETLRYTLRLQATDVPLDQMRFADDLGALNATASFLPGSLALVAASLPPGADASSTDPNGGTNGSGLLDIRNLDVPAYGQVAIQFDVTLAGTLANGTVVANQSDLLGAGNVKLADSDDPNVNGQADPAVAGDEDPTRVVIGIVPPAALLKENTQATATIGEAFRYRITVPATPYAYPIYDVRVADDLTASAADLRFLSVAKISGSGAWTPSNIGSPTNVVIEASGAGIDIPAGEQAVFEITVVLEDTATNIAGLAFANSASYTFNRVDGDVTSQLPGDAGTSPAMTVVEPALTLEKTGPAQMALGVPGTFTLNAHDTGASPAFGVTLTDRLPDGATGGMCDTGPTNVTARVFLADGVTPVSAPLVAGTDFSVAFAGAPSCQLTVSMLSAAATIGPDQRLIVTYDALLDANSQNGVALTNVAGATEWFSTDGANPVTAADRRTYTRTLTDGTPATLDHEDAHTVTVGLMPYRFEKTVTNVTTGASPALNATPGDRLRYQVRFENQGTTALTGLAIRDELDRLNDPAAFQAGTLALIATPPGADVSLTNATGGAKGTGLVDVRNLSAGPSETIVVEFEITLAAAIANGRVVENQSQLLANGGAFAESDDPNVNGVADPFVADDEDPTRVAIQSAPRFVVEKISADLTGSPTLLLPGETLRYTITVKNVGTADALDATLRDAVPANTQYVAGSTTLNGAAVADAPGGGSPLAQSIAIHAPQDPTPGTMRADASATTDNVAILVFDVVVDPGTANGTILSNQAFVSALQGGVSDTPSDDPRTSLPNDPTRNVVGSSPLLFAPKQVALRVDAGTPGIVDPGDVLHYTITVQNTGAVAATGVVLTDAVPANTTYVADTTTLNGLPVGQPDGGVAPLASGIAISGGDLTPPLPAPGQGTVNAGQSAVLEFDLQVNAGVPTGTLISNQARVATNELPVLLTDGDGNPSTGPEPTVVVVGDAQQLAITKQVAVLGGGPALAGSVLEYVVQITNVAAVPAYGVVITDDLDAATPGTLTYVAASATLNGAATGVSVVGSLITADYSTTYGPLQPGATLVLRFRAQIAPGLAIGTRVTNVGVVTWNGTQTANATVSVDVGGTPGVGALSGTAWHDANFDALAGAGERPLQGWSVELTRNGQLVQSVLTDANGAYSITGVTPNTLNGDAYVLRFRAPGAGASTASLGTASSVYTNGPQQISDIPVAAGSSLRDLNLPITPNGVVYHSLLRAPLGGAVLSLVNAGAGAPLPASCFDDPAQQGQVTRSDGFYKFDLNFSDATCTSGGSYVLSVVAPGSGFAAGYSQVIPPLSAPGTAPFSVPACPGSATDAVPATLQHCEVQPSELAPPASVPARSAGTNYYVHLALDDSQVPGSSQIFNNHIPLDPELAGAVTITKSTPTVNVSRGQLVPYEITVANQIAAPIPDLSIVDHFPAGFRYVEGSARLDGVPAEPVNSGRELLWQNVGIDASSRRTLLILLAVGAGVSEGEFVNRAQAMSSLTGTPLSGEATARVRVVPDPTFDCTDVLGKVFDDSDRDGAQDREEAGLPGVRLVTARGLVATTDRYGRFHITCAVTPNEARGSNFVLKLDDRSLPSGYRTTTPTTAVQRATRGKALRFHFGASIHRVVGLDLADAVFEPGTSEMRAQWAPRMDLLIEALREQPAILRLSYVGDLEDAGLVERRVSAIRGEIERAWGAGAYPLAIETEVFWRRGSPVDEAGAAKTSGTWRSLLPSVDAGPPLLDAQPGATAERHLPSDEPVTQWAQDPAELARQAGDRIEQREVVREQAKTVKLTNVVPPIRFASGVADIPPSTIQKLREILASMQHLANVRLHLVGHADDQPLSAALSGVFGDNAGLSRERAGEVAEFVQSALGLPPEAISFSWAGDTLPIASNATEQGRALNRRVEVEVWYDELEQKVGLEDVVVPEELRRFKVCRTETVCKLRYREGHARRARVKNLIAPLHFDDESSAVPDAFVRQIEQALGNLGSKQNVAVKLIGFTDDAPLSERAERIYGTHLALSKARAHRVALAVKDVLDLPTAAIASDGLGAAKPVTSNQTERGRTLNRRVEVEFWYDDPLQELPGEPQPCPDPADAELVTRVHEPSFGPLATLPIEEGEARIPAGYADDLRRAMAEVAGEKNVRLRIVGYTGNQTLDRRTARVYGDDVGLSIARARRTMERIRGEMGLSGAQVEAEGRGYVHSDDVVNAGFLAGETSHVAVQVVYDELAVVDELEGVDVTRMTRELSPKNPLALNLMRITVDGEPIDDPNRSLADVQRCTDVALDRADIQFGFDNQKAVARLSVTASPSSVAVPASGAAPAASSVRFAAYSNYGRFIARSEVRIFARGESREARPLAVVAVGADGRAEWQPDVEAFAEPVRELQFVLRAYDAEGRFDETSPQPLWLIHGDGAAPAALAAGRDPLLAGYGESGALARNIPLGNVGTVTVRGSGIPPEHVVSFAGSTVPVDADGRFAAEVLVPSGLHTVEVAVLDAAGNGELFLRDLRFPKNDWFAVGIADLTLVANTSHGPVEALEGKNAPYEHDSLADGRLAFFVSGKFGEDWALTASADTREGPLEDLFSNFLDKSPESLFRRLDPDLYLPTYGDDGTLEERAPTSGKLFAKLSKRDSHLLWGNFEVGYLDNELAHVDRGLYGANLRYESLATTGAGEKRVVVDGFAAEPGTVPSREEFRVTGGSLYWLSRQDLLAGSERLRVEVRDKDSGLVSSVVHLRPTVDYDIDYLQGRILLSEPIATNVSDALLVRSQGLSGNEAWLVAQYEYTPGFGDLDAMSFGGQGEAWLNDFVKLGVTANRNDDDGSESSLYAGHAIVRKSAESWIKLQAGRSEGLVSSSLLSGDGGFSFFGGPSAAIPESAEAGAYRAELSVGLADFLAGRSGRLHLYGQMLEAGYSAPGQSALTDTDLFGGKLELPLTKALTLAAKADSRSQDQGLETTAGEVDVAYALSERWTLSTGVRTEMRDDDSPVVPVTQEEGDRTDAVVQAAFASGDAWKGYAFAQATVAATGDREDNRRGGIGGAHRFGERLVVEGEVSHGDLGPAVKLGTQYQESESSHRYVSYALENDLPESGLHERRANLVSGARARLSDSGSVFLEDRYQHAGVADGVTRSMGIQLAPAERWSLGGNFAFGTLIDHTTAAETKRTAGGAQVGYAFDRIQLSSGVEYRFDETEQTDGVWTDRETWLFRSSLKMKLTPDWQLVGKLNHSFSDSSLGQFYDGDFTEGVVGYAFRPVDHDRLNALAKYTYFYNLPAAEQLTSKNAPAQYIQRSHVAALDISYDLTQRWTVGGKYAVRFGEMSLDRANPEFFDNSAHLFILRNDLRFRKHWEGSVEARMLDLPDLNERRAGALISISRYLGEHFKVGAGYNFTDFSENLTDLSYDDHGFFLNLVGSL